MNFFKEIFGIGKPESAKEKQQKEENKQRFAESVADETFQMLRTEEVRSGGMQTLIVNESLGLFDPRAFFSRFNELVKKHGGIHITYYNQQRMDDMRPDGRAIIEVVAMKEDREFVSNFYSEEFHGSRVGEGKWMPFFDRD